MNNDKIIGFLMVLVSLAVIATEVYYLLVAPLKVTTGFETTATFWALSIPVLLATTGLFLIVAWIGLTLIKTPPPEEWSFEELDETEKTAE